MIQAKIYQLILKNQINKNTDLRIIYIELIWFDSFYKLLMTPDPSNTICTIEGCGMSMSSPWYLLILALYFGWRCTKRLPFFLEHDGEPSLERNVFLNERLYQRNGFLNKPISEIKSNTI
jgi:hypothetical protein